MRTAVPRNRFSEGINWSLDEQADQILSVTVKGTNYLVWRMLLNTKVFSEKNAPSTLDAKWLKFIPLIALVILIVMVALKYRDCSGVATMFLCCRSYIVGMRTTVSTTKNWRNASVSVAM